MSSWQQSSTSLRLTHPKLPPGKSVDTVDGNFNSVGSRRKLATRNVIDKKTFPAALWLVSFSFSCVCVFLPSFVNVQCVCFLYLGWRICCCCCSTVYLFPPSLFFQGVWSHHQKPVSRTDCSLSCLPFFLEMVNFTSFHWQTLQWTSFIHLSRWYRCFQFFWKSRPYGCRLLFTSEIKTLIKMDMFFYIQQNIQFFGRV